MRYKIRYTLEGKPMALFTDASGPVKALDQFHSEMQLVDLVEPTAYEIVSLALCYNKDPQGKVSLGQIESPFDIPKSANPILRPKEVKKEQNIVMPFMDDIKVTRYERAKA